MNSSELNIYIQNIYTDLKKIDSDYIPYLKRLNPKDKINSETISIPYHIMRDIYVILHIGVSNSNYNELIDIQSSLISKMESVQINHRLYKSFIAPFCVL